MEKDSCISGRQMIAIFLASRLAVSLTAVPTLYQTSHSVDFLLSSLLQIGLLFILYLPIWWFSHRTNAASTLDYAYLLFNRGGHIIAALYAAYSLYVQMTALTRFDYFVSTALSPDMSQVALCILLVVAAFLAALHGIQAIARTATLIALAVVGTVIFVFIALLPEMKALHFPPLLYDGFSPVLSGALEELPRTLEVASLGILLPYVKGNITKNYLRWTVALTFVILLIQTSVIGVLGDYSEIVLFPYYTAVTVAQIGVLQRVDIIATAVWIAALFIKMAFFATLFMSCMQRLFGEKKKTLYAVIGGLSVLLVGLFWGNSPFFQERTLIWGLSTLCIALFAVGLPLFLIAADQLRRKKAKKGG